MKKPIRHTVADKTNIFKNENKVPEKIHTGKEVLRSKSQIPLINQNLYDRIGKASDLKNLVMADIARMALQFYLENPEAEFDSELLKDNVKPLQYRISLLEDKKIQDYKNSTGINRSIMIRRALSAWLIHEGY